MEIYGLHSARNDLVLEAVECIQEFPRRRADAPPVLPCLHDVAGRHQAINPRIDVMKQLVRLAKFSEMLDVSQFYLAMAVVPLPERALFMVDWRMCGRYRKSVQNGVGI